MEDLFSTPIAVNNQDITYRVTFADDRYTFASDAADNAFSTFSVKREADEWHSEDGLPPDIKNQAVDALEKYLLRQH